MYFAWALCVAALIHGPISSSEDTAVLKQLWEEYKRYGLPLPPHDASLVRIEDSDDTSDGKNRRAYLALAFKKPAVLRKSEIWGGCEVVNKWSLYRKSIVLCKPTAAVLEGTIPLASHLFEWDIFPTDTDLGLAIHSYALGWEDLGVALLARHRQNLVPHGKRPVLNSAASQGALAQMAWNYWCNQFARDRGDRSQIVERMLILATGPYGLNSSKHRNIIADMQATLKPSTSKRESLEAAIDQLVDLTERGSWLATGYDNDVSVESPLYYKIIHAGLDAVPTLVRHLDDFRMTRIVANDRDNYHWNVRIADVVAVRLRQLMGQELRYDILKREGRGVRVDRQQVETWAGTLRTVNERQYLLDHAFDYQRNNDNESRANAEILQTLAARYPDDFARLWRVNVGKDDHSAYAFAPALKGSRLVKNVQEDLVLSAIMSSSDDWRYVTAFQCPNHPALPALIISWMENIPKAPVTESSEITLLRLLQIVVKMDNDDVWNALAKMARRLNLNQRLEVIEHVNQEDHYPHRQIALCRQFLIDTSERTKDDNASGIPAGFRYDRLRVCDFAAEQLGVLLDIESIPMPAWQQKEWSVFQEKVTDALRLYDEQRKVSKP